MNEPAGPQGDSERALLEALARFLDHVAREAAFAEDRMREALDSLTDLVEADGPTDEKDHWVAALLGMYGGMGSINDYPWSPEAEVAKERLYETLKAARGLYYGVAGGEQHDPDSFPVLGLGTRVRLVPGRVYYVDTAGHRHTVTAEEFSPELVWTVQAVYGPDITGVPTYGLVSGNRHMSGRVTALEVVGDPAD